MKVLMINVVCGRGSTGRICTDLASSLEEQGHEVKIAYGRGSVPDPYQKYAIRIGGTYSCRFHALKTRLFDIHGFCSVQATKNFLAWAESYKPDLLWLHNIHGYYINVEMLFEWIKKHPDMDVKWTLHDCWAFTGHCAYFTACKCEQWKKICKSCNQKQRYPKSLLFSNVEKNFIRKKKAFTGVKKLSLITPSKWLADLTRESFLKEYPVDVQYNKIDTNIFKPTTSAFRKRYLLEDKFVILGVANIWEERKGIKDFFWLSHMLDESYAIVLVGIPSNLIRKLPEKIIGIAKTNSPKELAEIYSACDVFVNPTYEDNYPTVNLEAQACGIPVITYDTGGCRETIFTNNSCVIATGCMDDMLMKIKDYKLKRVE